jgi:hypothetical protein
VTRARFLAPDGTRAHALRRRPPRIVHLGAMRTAKSRARNKRRGARDRSEPRVAARFEIDDGAAMAYRTRDPEDLRGDSIPPTRRRVQAG